VNFNAAAEEVAAMFEVRIVPVSSGTPQENAYAESAVGTIAAMSRSLMTGAPHLDGSCWGLADVYSANIHETLPQPGNNNMSPFEMKKGWTPDPDTLFIHVFGCPVQYEPHGGALHKRGRKTEWGYFVGVQWPIVLILRPEDGKIMSVSRKKVLCHEEIYATFDAKKGLAPVADFDAFKIDLDNVKREVEGLNQIGKFKQLYNIPDHVLSVKLLDDYKRNSEFNQASPADPPRKMMEAILPHAKVQGENPVEMIDALNSDLLMEEIGRVKENLRKLDAEDGRAEAILCALRKVEEELANEAPRKGCLKRKKKPRKAEIDVDNIMSTERTKAITWQLPDSEKDSPESPARKMLK
jgi:hypothetical protein